MINDAHTAEARRLLKAPPGTKRGDLRNNSVTGGGLPAANLADLDPTSNLAWANDSGINAPSPPQGRSRNSQYMLFRPIRFRPCASGRAPSRLARRRR